MGRSQCQECLCATCKANSFLFDTQGTNICVGCNKCEDFAVDKHGQCPLGQYEKIPASTEYDEEAVVAQRRLLGISNRIIYGSVGICILMCLFINNSTAAGIIEGSLLLVAAGAFLMRRKYSNLLAAEALTRIPEPQQDEGDEAA